MSGADARSMAATKTARADSAEKAERDLIRLVYASHARADLAAADLDAIEASARRNNAARGLSGFLIHGGHRFYGLLEGPRRRVLARMEKIMLDPRHRRIVVVSEEDVQERRFSSWSFCRLSAEGDGADGPDLLDSFILTMARGG